MSGLMPEVVGLNYESALVAMIQAGVRQVPLNVFTTDPVAIEWVETPAAKRGFVIAQTPFAGTWMETNSPVTLTVSNYRASIGMGVTQV